MELAKRLAALAEYVPAGSIVADIGTDHAYLPVFLVKSGICPRVIATDIKAGPFCSADRQVKEHGLRNKIDLRLGDGLKTLQPGEAQVLVLSGMGGNTIRHILAQSPDVLNRVDRLILQPMADPGDLRSWLAVNGWMILDEKLVEEDGRIYVVMVAEPGCEIKDPLMLELGPRLLENRDPLLNIYLGNIIDKYERVLSGLAASKSKTAKEKEQQLKIKLAEIRRVRECR